MALPAILATLAPYLLSAGAGAAGSALSRLFGQGNQQSNQGSFFGGTPASNTQIPRLSPQQVGAQNQLLQSGLSGLQNLQQPFNFGPIEQQARSGFANQTVPSIAERFTSLGSGGALSSPAFASQLGQAGSGLNESLAALRSQIGLQQQGQQQNLFQNLLNLGLQPQTENIYQQREPGFNENFGPGLLQTLILSLVGGIPGFGSKSMFANNSNQAPQQSNTPIGVQASIPNLNAANNVGQSLGRI